MEEYKCVPPPAARPARSPRDKSIAAARSRELERERWKSINERITEQLETADNM